MRGIIIIDNEVGWSQLFESGFSFSHITFVSDSSRYFLLVYAFSFHSGPSSMNFHSFCFTNFQFVSPECLKCSFITFSNRINNITGLSSIQHPINRSGPDGFPQIIGGCPFGMFIFKHFHNLCSMVNQLGEAGILSSQPESFTLCCCFLELGDIWIFYCVDQASLQVS